MSLKVMTWAWTIPLPPAPKLVLTALADEADDRGFCFPSQRRIAEKCNITERSVRRLMCFLAAQGHLTVEQRFHNRARTSNGYHLAIDPRTNCPGVPDSTVRGDRTRMSGGSGHVCPGAPDSGVRVTTTNPCIYPIPPPPGPAFPHRDRAASSNRDDQLCFPKALSNAHRNALQTQLESVSIENAQQVLDELAGRMKTTEVRNPIRYCAVLISRLERGQFRPELAIQVADQRRAEQQRDAKVREVIAAAQPAVESSLDRLPHSVRSSLERMRPKPKSCPSNRNSSSSLSTSAETKNEVG